MSLKQQAEIDDLKRRIEQRDESLDALWSRVDELEKASEAKQDRKGRKPADG